MSAGFLCLLVIFAYLYGQVKGQAWTAALDKIFSSLSGLSPVAKLVERVRNTLDMFLDEFVGFIIDFVVWESDEEKLIEAKALAVVTKLREEAAELRTKHNLWKEILQEDLEIQLAEYRAARDSEVTNQISAFKTELGAHEFVIGNSVGISDLQTVWTSELPSSCTSTIEPISDQQDRVIGHLVDAMLELSTDCVVECAEGKKFSVNSLVFILLSPVFASIFKSQKNFKLAEISGRRLAKLVQMLSSRKCELPISDVVAVLNVADYLGMETVLPELRAAVTNFETSDAVRAAACIAEVNLSGANLSEDAVSWNFPISALTKEAMACFTHSTFGQVLGDRKISRKADLEALLRYKESSGDFRFFENLATDELDASVLGECERLLDADAYASLLTAVLTNIEKENARLSRLQSLKESPSAASEQQPQLQPQRSFRYSYTSVDYHRTFDRPRFSHNQLWFVTVLAGVVNGVVRGAIRDAAHILFDWRIDAMKAVSDASLWLSFVVFLGIALALVLVASLLVLLEPLTAGTGTADVAAALNGINVPRFFTFRTAVIKFLSTLLTAASGLIWVGPESSMSHLGGATNILVAEFMRTVLPSAGDASLPLNDAERLDLIGTGMAMGVSAAFRTTLAGIIYMAEGMAPLWRVAAFWRALIGTLFAVYVAKLIDEYFVCNDSTNTVMCVSAFGYVAYPLKNGSSVDFLTFLAILCTSVFSGLSGGFFASVAGWLGLRLASWLPLDRKLRRVLFALAGMTLTCLLVMCLVMVTSCEALPSGLEAGASTFLYEDNNFCPSGTYNPAAVILLSHHEYAVRYLYNDDAEVEFWLLICCWLLVYILAIPFVYMPLPVGFLTPNLLAGALVGRFFAKALGSPAAGIVSVCGSAASLASYFRFPLTSSVFMIQMTSAGRLYMPIIGSVIIATAVAYPISPSLMEIIMRVKKVPYLPRLHRSVVQFFAGKHIDEYMTRLPLVTLNSTESRANLETTLESTHHSGIPVITANKRVLAVLPRNEANKLLQATHADEINLGQIDSSFNAFTVETNHEFLRCYRLFRHLGLRHMVVVHWKTKEIAGIVTRSDLVRAITAVPKPHYYYVTL